VGGLGPVVWILGMKREKGGWNDEREKEREKKLKKTKREKTQSWVLR
jgi:hypothetical protein